MPIAKSYSRTAWSPSTFIEPLLLSEQEKPPAGADWVHEIKLDGYRVQAHVAGGKVTVYTRRGNDWTRQFRPLADAVAKLPVKRAIIDGEAVVLSEAGLAEFHALRGALDGRSTRLRLYAFAASPYWSGRSTAPWPWPAASSGVDKCVAHVRYCEAFKGRRKWGVSGEVFE